MIWKYISRRLRYFSCFACFKVDAACNVYNCCLLFFIFGENNIAHWPLHRKPLDQLTDYSPSTLPASRVILGVRALNTRKESRKPTRKSISVISKLLISHSLVMINLNGKIKLKYALFLYIIFLFGFKTEQTCYREITYLSSVWFRPSAWCWAVRRRDPSRLTSVGRQSRPRRRPSPSDRSQPWQLRCRPRSTGNRSNGFFEIWNLKEKIAEMVLRHCAAMVLGIISHCKIAGAILLTNCHWLKLRTIPNILLTRIFIYNGC